MRELTGHKQKSWKFLLEMVTLVSSENNIGSDIEFILRGKVIYICYWTIVAIELVLGGTPCFSVP